MSNVSVIKGIAFDGGGVCGISHAGALDVLESKGVLKDVTHYSGSSAGSIIAGLLACKVPLSALKMEIEALDFNKFKDDTSILSGGYIADFYRLINEYGWYKGQMLEDWYGVILKKYSIDENITLKGVYDKYGSFLIITTVDVNCARSIYMTPMSHPNLKLKVAIHRSSCIPIFFKACTEKTSSSTTHYYVDGGTLDNYPIRELYKYLPSQSVIGIKLMTTRELNELDYYSVSVGDGVERIQESIPPANIVDYITVLVSMIRNQALKIHIHNDDWLRTIKIDIGTISAIKMDLTKEDKDFLYKQGQQAAHSYYTTPPPIGGGSPIGGIVLTSS